MIKLGVCTALENAPILAQAGYDYIETALNSLAALSDAAFAQAQAALARSGLPCEAMNCMLPGDLPVVGPRVDREKIERYLTLAFSRAQALGTEVIVFGSGGSRGVPEGFPWWRAWGQLRDYLVQADRLAGEYGLRVAIEPLRREECNILHYVSEALQLAAVLDLPRVGVLGDTYHMALGGEPLAALAQAGDRLWHVHVACPEGRAFPKNGDPADRRGEYRALFEALRSVDYQGRVSIEGNCGDLAAEADASFALLAGLR